MTRSGGFSTRSAGSLESTERHRERVLYTVSNSRSAAVATTQFCNEAATVEENPAQDVADVHILRPVLFHLPTLNHIVMDTDDDGDDRSL